MKITAVFDSVSRANGGVFEAERRLWPRFEAQPGTQVFVFGLADSFAAEDRAQWQPLQPRVCAVTGPRAFGYSTELREELARTDAEIVYRAGLWQYPSLAVVRWAQRTRRPYIVAPHGMLDPWALQNSAWKKRLARWLYEDVHLRKAGCFRALCTAEARAIRQLGLRNPICVIPNGVDFPDTKAFQSTDGPVAKLKAEGKKVLLYLGRLHPKKGLPNLVKAWSKVSRKDDWHLAICGWDQGGHEAELKQLAAGSNSISFPGPQYGDAKAACYAACDAFILPSFSEGLPMAVLEAWASARPVLMTPECNLPEGFAREAALEIQASPESIEQGLTCLFRMSDAERAAMGARGLALAREQFSWPRIVQEMRAMCEWILGGGAKPATLAAT